jgi:WD40 repeat protein
MLLRRQSNQALITLSEPMLIGTGGEARVYALPETPSLVAKIYHQPTGRRAHKLAAMLANPPQATMNSSGHASIAWPVDLLLSADKTRRSYNSVVGFLMPRINRMKPIIDFYHPRTRRQACPLFSYLYLHRAGRNLAAAVRSLHERGYVIGDLNESNILVSETALVTLVDTDSFQVRDTHGGEVYRCAVGKPEFTPPELQDKSFAEIDREPAHDLFGLAVILFQLLMEGTHPFAGQFTGRGEPPAVETRISSGHFPHAPNGLLRRVPYRPVPAAPPFYVLSPPLRELFVRCFDDGHREPQARPDARVWAETLKEAEDALLTCAANGQHRYGTHLAECPWCDRTKQLAGRDPFPSMQAVRKGQHLAAAPKKPKPQPQTTATQPYIIYQAQPSTAHTPPPSVSQSGKFANRLQAVFSGIGGGRLLWILWLLFWGLRTCANFIPDNDRKNFVPPTYQIPSNYQVSPTPYATLSGHTGSVQAVAFSPDGGLVASSGRDAKIRVWRVRDKQLIRTLEGHLFNITALTFAPQGSLGGYDLASGSYDKTLALWQLNSSRVTKLSPPDGSGISSLAFSRDGRLLATGSYDARVRLWDVASGMLLREFNDHWLGIVAVAFSEDGITLASGSGDGLIKLRNAQTGQTLKTLAIDPMATKTERSLSGEDPVISAMAFSSDLGLIAAAGYDKRLQVWDVKGGAIKRTLASGQDFALSLSFARNGRALIGGYRDGGILLWNIATGLILQSYIANTEAINAVAISPTGTYAVSGGSDNEVRIWRITIGGVTDLPNSSGEIPPPLPPPRPQ